MRRHPDSYLARRGLAEQAPSAPGCPEKEADGVVAGRHRATMLARPMKNIIECKPGQQCRLGADNRFKVLGQKGAAGMVKTGCAATAWRR